MTIERMFLSVSPPPEVIDAISDLPTEPLRGVRFTRRNQWHISLRFLGDVERHHALHSLSELSASGALVTLGPQVELLGNRVVILPADGLNDLAAAVAERFDGVGEPVEREYQGHLTLARLKGRPLKNPSLVSVLGAPLSATFAVDTIDLWKTEITDEGTTHTIVATQELS